jgi:hypothetical protein
LRKLSGPTNGSGNLATAGAFVSHEGSTNRVGDFATAWDISDVVLASRDAATRDDPASPYHLRWVWDGRPFADRHVLVRCYHGLGDTLQFARYLPALRRSVASLTVEVQPELLPLLRSLPGPDRWVAFDPAAPLPPMQCDLEIMELAHALRLPPAAIAPPYLCVAPAPCPPHTVGLCWQAGGWDTDRSLPFETLAALGAPPIVSLQRGASPNGVLNPEGCSDDIVGTAALIAGTDLVITVDTMVAHLAGALGHPTWLLLKQDADWRWMTDRVDSPWYPSMRIYWQRTKGDWVGVVAEIAADLSERRKVDRPDHGVPFV